MLSKGWQKPMTYYIHLNFKDTYDFRKKKFIVFKQWSRLENLDPVV